tara:strand:+ start:1140 stop:2051 length:912 start_codon:yes stop_codon:yes gene_type:complete
MVLVKVIWAEKYRPKILDEVLSQDSVVSEMRAIVSGDAPMQHFLFHSPEPGSGKTTMARVMADELGYQLHEFNASTKKQRGIDFVEDDIAPMSRIGQFETIFLLDEADRITPTAQDALKGVIENAQGYFILTCNDLNKVSPWLKSRCQVRTFKPIPDDLVMERLKHICVQEAVEMTEDDLLIIIKKHGGDMRNAIGALQAASYLSPIDRQQFIASISTPTIDAGSVLTICFKMGNVPEAVKILSQAPAREAIHQVFLKAIEANITDHEKKMLVVEASIQARRDLINGVPEVYVIWEFCRFISQ